MAQLNPIAKEGNMSPIANKNVRRLVWLRNLIYLTLVVVGFAVLGIKTLLAR